MRSWQETRLTGTVQRHDEKLFVKKDDFGRMVVWREGFDLITYNVDGSIIHCLSPSPRFIMALTENWSLSGEPCEWGVEPLLERLKAIDSWNLQSFVNAEMEGLNERSDESRRRSMNNKLEAAAYESYGVFKKTFADINTANMNKIEKRKLKGV